MENNETNRQHRNLRTILIEPFKQIKLGVYVIALTSTFIFLMGLLFVNAFSEQYQHVMEIFQVVDPKFKWQLVTNDIFKTNVVRMVVLLVVFVISLLLVIFRVTNKYYGPLVSIERFVDSIANGDYSQRLVLRRGDELQVVLLCMPGSHQALLHRRPLPRVARAPLRLEHEFFRGQPELALLASPANVVECNLPVYRSGGFSASRRFACNSK